MKQAFHQVKTSLIKADIPLIALIFCLLFAPPVIPKINLVLIIGVLMFAVLMIFYRKQLISTIVESGMKHFLIIMIVFFAYIGIVTVVNYFTGEFVQLMHYIKLWYRFFLIVPVLLIYCVYFCIRCREKNYSVYDLAKHYIYAAMIQFGLVMIAIIFPAVKDAFISVIYKNTGELYLGIPWVMERRGFGFSSSFVDNFGFGMGIIAALPLFFLKKKRIALILYVPCLLLISIVNVRTGLVMAVIGMLFALPSIYKTFIQAKARVIAAIMAALLILIGSMTLVHAKSPKTLPWIFEDVVSFLGIELPESSPETTPSTTPGPEATPSAPEATTTPSFWEQLTTSTSQHNTADVLFSDTFWNLPEGLALIFGTGHTIYGAEGYAHSDGGYVNDLWLGGIVGTLILYAAIAWLMYKAFRATGEISIKCLILFFACAMLVFQVKANAIMLNTGIVTILPMLFVICYTHKKAPEGNAPIESTENKETSDENND